MLLSIAILILTPLTYWLFLVRQEKEKFKNAFNQFNENRHNPLTELQFKSLYEFENKTLNLWIPIKIDLKSTNHRNGDEIMENKSRLASKRISDHLNLNSKKSGSSYISSLGYNFNNPDNFIKFTATLAGALPNNCSQAFPINKTWFIISKHDQGLGISFKKDIFQETL